MGKLWKKKGVYDTFEEAFFARNKIMEENAEEEYFQVKIKRCGPGGTSFMVKIRYNTPEEKKKTKKKS